MDQYQIVFTRSARKELQTLPYEIAARVLGKIGSLASKPRPPLSKKLRGHTTLWRLRVGDYRVVYSIDDDSKVVDVSAVRHRSEAYR